MQAVIGKALQNLFITVNTSTLRWRRGVAVECRTCDQEVVGSSLSRAPSAR